MKEDSFMNAVTIPKDDFADMVSMARIRLERKKTVTAEELASLYYGEFPFKHKHLSNLDKIAMADMAIARAKE